MTEEKMMVVLDDDPTGTQTVHGVTVYTDWEEETLKRAFGQADNMFYVLTNSRSFTEEKTKEVHRTIARRLCGAAREWGKDFLLISRGDSTLRGHFPAETQVLKETIEAETGSRFDGEILCPCFLEGGRVTEGDIHYVIEHGHRIPVGETEFAKDAAFGYRSSDLKKYVEEKTEGRYPASSCMSFSAEELAEGDIPELTEKLCRAAGFQKIIVNAADYSALTVFCRVFREAVRKGHRYLLRTAASFPKVLGGISDIPLLTAEQIKDPGNPQGGLVLIGSHVEKSTKQLESLKRLTGKTAFTEFHTDSASEKGNRMEQEAEQAAEAASEQIANGITAVIYTSREAENSRSAEESLSLSVRISEAFTGITGRLSRRPAFIIAKGGITSSDVAGKALHIKQARVMGQIRPGIPVWKCGKESLFPGISLIIFPGNVGEENTLFDIVHELIQE